MRGDAHGAGRGLGRAVVLITGIQVAGKSMVAQALAGQRLGAYVS